MSDQPCSGCGASFPIKSLYDLNDKAYCSACVKPAVDAAKTGGQPAVPTALINKSICARCNNYLTEGVPFVQMRHLRFCQTCAAMIKDWKYPQWLRLSFVGLLLLLVVALAHGAKYFAAGKSLYTGERLVMERKYAEALPQLQKTLKVAPGSDKAALLAAKAALLSGRPDIAGEVLQGHNNGYFEDADKPEFKEVNDLWNRANAALEDIGKAEKLGSDDGHEVEADQLVHQAAAKYPEFPYMDLLVDRYDSGVAFAKKDYDAFLTIAEKDWAKFPSPSTAAMLSSALDCKFAISGNEQFRQRSEEMLAKANDLAKGDPEEQKSLAEFRDRHKYRLESRQIISKSEYDRRFRQNQQQAKSK
jgi:hypothetical protein